MSNSRGIDIYNGSGTVDFQAAINGGLKFCIARCGYGEDRADQDDGQFQRNYDQCKTLGIPLGSFFYTCALTVGGTESEKAHLKRLLAGKSFEMPVFVDMEDADGYKARNGGVPDAQTNTNIIKELCEFIKSLGITPGFYVNKDWAENHVYMDQLTEYAFYYARPGQPQPDRPCYLWQDQIGSTGGHFPGVQSDAAGKCDTDILMTDLPAKAPQPSTPASPAPQSAPETYTVSSTTNAYVTAANAVNKASAVGTVSPGSYFVFNRSQGMVNVTKVQGQPGSWINPNDSAPAAPAESTTTYTVQPGDDLTHIASRYGITVADILALNPNIKNPNIIHPGDVFVVRGCGPAHRTIDVGAQIRYSGHVYADSYGGGEGRSVDGVFTVDIYKPDRDYGTHIASGWIKTSDATVI